MQTTRMAQLPTHLWDLPSFNRLPAGAMLTILNLYTHARAVSGGVFRATVPGLAKDLKQPEARFQAYFEAALNAEEEGTPYVLFDRAAGVIFLPFYFDWNTPEGIEDFRRMVAGLETLPRCELRAAAIAKIEAWASCAGAEFVAVVDAWKKGGDLFSAGLQTQKRAKRLKHEYPPEFIEFMEVFPPRSGNQPWPAAFRAWRARVREGYKPGTFLRGARNYRAWCEATKKFNTETVMEAKTFLGPDLIFMQEFKITEVTRETAGNLSAGERQRHQAAELGTGKGRNGGRKNGATRSIVIHDPGHA